MPPKSFLPCPAGLQEFTCFSSRLSCSLCYLELPRPCSSPSQAESFCSLTEIIPRRFQRYMPTIIRKAMTKNSRPGASTPKREKRAENFLRVFISLGISPRSPLHFPSYARRSERRRCPPAFPAGGTFFINTIFVFIGSFKQLCCV